MDLRPYIKTDRQRQQLAELLSGYQPYILSDDLQTGEGYLWCTGKNVKKMNRREVGAKEWLAFVDANQRMRTMYEDFIALICNTVPQESRVSVLDAGCNDGYFIYSFLRRGSKFAVGFDLVDRKPLFTVMNDILNLNAIFIHTKYDSYTHVANGIESADLVISTAVMCHLSDPLYYLAYLGQLAKKALFLFSTIDRSDEYYIRYEGYNYYWSQPYPLGFDKLNHVSLACVDLGLRELGFNKIIELPYRSSWLPQSWYKQFMALIALRT